jgi:hypothetical protein
MWRYVKFGTVNVGERMIALESEDILEIMATGFYVNP